ncbi:hypothetical protein L226DRAFT_472205 [Lentinus tigrinus ALCF2SS1-7]|uniref:uncharacterized protein n=1 Tax=Lentinus tigrinus ALCF2SS1-7 TaxID=1328758 RepID=UPI0011663275|nr:hypothetical protein L226DRAFT_472205 [Lentinus tigrinus ALCF2SS1-7]
MYLSSITARPACSPSVCRTPCYIADRRGIIFTTLAGMPNDPEWPSLVGRVTEKLARAQRLMAELEDEPDHRRGSYFYGHRGFSIGQGQKRPGNLRNSARRQEILEELRTDPDVIRVANFANGALHNYVPNVFDVYKDNMDALLEWDPSLQRNFPNNVFAAATFNLRPRVATHVHLDLLNYAYGMCAVFAAGNYDYKQGGHIILWDAKLIIEFPPGATILLPSAILRHSNVTIRPHETRYSLTQYTAGGLFRWVRAGFRTQKSLQAAGLDLSNEYEEWKEGWRMYPTVDQMYSP